MAELPNGLKITWLGHATFLFETEGKRLLVDPWVKENPACPEELKDVGELDGMLITHAHFDHIADAVDLGKSTDAQIGCIAETAAWLGTKGLENVVGYNKGGTAEIAGGDGRSRAPARPARNAVAVPGIAGRSAIGDRLGHGVGAANLSLVIARGSVAETIFVSREGRVRR